MLTSVDRAILDLERTWWLVPGPKEWAMGEHVGLEAAEYYARLSQILWSDGAFAYDPLTVLRLRRLIGAPVGRTAEGQ